MCTDMLTHFSPLTFSSSKKILFYYYYFYSLLYVVWWWWWWWFVSSFFSSFHHHKSAARQVGRSTGPYSLPIPFTVRIFVFTTLLQKTAI